MYAYSVSTKRSVVVAVAALALVMSGQRAHAQPLQQQQTVTPPGGTDAPRSLVEARQLATAREFVLDDPLDSVVANSPDGPPFPVGMTGLPNLEQNPGNPDPRTVGPLAVGADIRSQGRRLRAARAASGGVAAGGLPCAQPPENCTVPDNASAFNSTPAVFITADDFTPAFNGSITAACWWGTYFDGIGDCNPGLDHFVVRYYLDEGSLPGTIIAEFSQDAGTLMVSPATLTGGMIAGFLPEYEYSASHDPVPVVAGDCYWIEITNDPPGADCNWFWEIATGGNDRAVQDGSPPDGYDAGDVVNTDLAFCLSVELGDATLCLPPPSELIWFTNQADFEAFNQGKGKVSKGTEDFEESILDPNNVFGFDDPLESGVPNSPNGLPFPVGMTGLPNLIVQSNLEHSPGNPNPRGVDGLVAVSDGFFGVVSDVVFAGFNVDSLDLIFTGEKSSVGFNTLTILVGVPSVEVRVYSTTNLLLGIMTTPADPKGDNFIGVWSPTPIGRINIFDPGGGAEGVDNIQAWQEGAPCPADLVVDGDVGVNDLLFLLGAWGDCPKKGDCPADFDNTGDVGVPDLLFLLGAWGPC